MGLLILLFTAQSKTNQFRGPSQIGFQYTDSLTDHVRFLQKKGHNYGNI